MRQGPVIIASHHTEWRRCPYCGVLHDAATGINDDADGPHDGAAMICIECGNLGIADASVEGGWRLPSAAERRDALRQDNVRLGLSAVATIRERRRP